MEKTYHVLDVVADKVLHTFNANNLREAECKMEAYLKSSGRKRDGCFSGFCLLDSNFESPTAY
jgi:hypothetical protein